MPTNVPIPKPEKESKPAPRRKLFSVVEKPKAEKIRVELNIERWPAIWQPAKSKNKPQLRVFEREATMPDGTRVISRVEVSYNHLGTLTTEEQKMFYALIKHWEDSGRGDQQIFFSDRTLARILGKGWGTNVIEAITKSLRKLRSISLEWVNSYYDKTHEGTMLRQRRPFTILGELKIVERAEDGAVNKALGYFRFDDHILRNLLANYTKPFLLEEFFKIKTDIGLLLYNHVDLIMANKQRYERCTKDLFDDLGLKNAEYNFMHKRKRALETPLKELLGLRLSTGVITGATIEKTADKKDYKVVFQKSAARAQDLAEPAAAPAPVADEPAVQEIVINHYLKPKDSLRTEARAVVEYFYKLFHSIETTDVPEKAIDQAVTLIASYGFDKAKFIVEFTYESAKQTKFDVQHFGAILGYASRAIAEYERWQAGQERMQQVESERAESSEREAAERRVAEERLQRLTPAQYDALYARVQAQLAQQYPWMAQQPDNAIHQGAIRAGMLRELAQPMDLLVVEPPASRGSDPAPAAHAAGDGALPYPAPDEPT